MTPDRSMGLTDAMIERMLVERSGSLVPSGFVESVVSAAGATPQRRARGLPSIVGRRRVLAWSLIAIALALLAAVAAIAGASLLVKDSDRSLMLIAQLDMDRPDGAPPSTISIFELDPATQEQVPIATFPVSGTTPVGTSMRAIWAPDHRHALLFDDLDGVAGIVDIASHEVTPLRLEVPVNETGRDGADQITWSPAGDRFAWLSADEQGNSRLVITDLAGRDMREIALPAALAACAWAPRWSPDGASIRVMSTGQFWCPPGPRLQSIPLDGASIRTLLDDSWDGGLPEWSPDGSEFAYESAKGLTIVDTEGRQTTVTYTNNNGFTWSPDGHHIAWFRSDTDLNRYGIFVIDTADGYVREKDLTQLTDGRDSDPQWSADGRSLVFSRDMGQGDPSVWVVSIDGGPPVRLVDHARADW